MTRACVMLTLLFGTLQMAAQTVYYNHPKGVLTGPFYKGEQAQVAKLTLPAGTYHVIFKSQFESGCSFYPGYCGDHGLETCKILGTGISNVTNPYTLDSQQIVTPEINSWGYGGNMVMEAAFSTNGGTVTVLCSSGDYALESARTSL